FLHNNRIQSIPRGAFKNLHSLKRLRLDSNALVCDCQLLWLAKMVKDRNTKTQVAATCEFPTGLQGKSISSITDSEFHCKGLPEITEEPTDVEVNFGGTAYFSCRADGDPHPEVVWLHNNEVVAENSRINVLKDGTLMIENTQDVDGGFYECKAINYMGEAYSRKAKIVMQDQGYTKTESISSDQKPYFLVFPTDKNVTAGSSVEFECQADGIPKPTLSWTKDNFPVTIGPRIQIINGHLIISETRLEDSGIYKCQAFSRLGRASASAYLHIPALPRFTLEPRDIFTSEGGTAVFSCEAEGDPTPTISWYRNDVPLRPTARINIFTGGKLLLIGNRLIIQDVKRYDEGDFTCKAENNAGAVNADAALYVRDKLAPIIKDEPRDVTVSAGGQAELKCTAQGLPPPSITWKRDGSTVTNDQKYQISSDGSLIIDNVSSEDEGLYECSASNYVGYAAVRATLTIQYKSRPHLGDKYLEASYEEAKRKVNAAFNDTVSLLFNQHRTKRPEPHELLRIFRFPQYEGRDIARIAETIEQTLEIVQRHVEAGMKFNLTDFKYEDLLSPTKLLTLSDISGCLGHRRPVTECDDMCFHLKYRTIDGTCNNLKNPMWGASLTGFKRFLKPIYENGFNTPVGWTKTKKYYGYFKPSARVVSTRLLSTEYTSPDDHCTHMLMQWGQFLDHDLDHALPSISTESFKTGVPCGKNCEYSTPCFPIEIPTDDPRVRHRCMEFTRSSAVCGSGMSSVFFDKVLPREQINQLTSYIDGSQIYSSSNPELRSLRNLTFPSGELRGGILGPTGKPLLPFSNGLPIDCRRDHSESAIDCFLGGDIRANEQVGLLSMHTLWFREHNRIAKELRNINPHWDSDTLFHEARKIVGATVQHITYAHWLPHVFGEEGMKKLGPFQGYNSDVEPTISNVFATAALRPIFRASNVTFFLHCIQKGFVSVFNIKLVKMRKPGQFLNLELTEKLFRSAHEIALDLAAMNVQRGRDHALPGYLEWRKFCNLSQPQTFDELEQEITSKEVRAKLRQLYGHPGNVDIFVGGILEDQINGARIGPTFLCILIQQFKNLRDGDRFWYENPWVFKPQQLLEIKKATLGRVLCDNGDNITDVTKDVFILPQEQVPSFVSCSQIPKIDLRLWTECCETCGGEDSLDSFNSFSQRFRRQAAKYSYQENSIYGNFNDSLIKNSYLGRVDEESSKTKFNSVHRRISDDFEDYEHQNDHHELTSLKGIDQNDSEDPLEGYAKDVTEERIEGIEAIVEQLSDTVESLLRKPKGVKCRVINCPEATCENPVDVPGSCCPKC
ncbi:Peroxidasin-like protein, partial [Armadillidium vulgare]